MKDLYLTSYGDLNNHSKGIIKIDTTTGTQECIPLDGKANMVLDIGCTLITSVKSEKGNSLVFVSKNGTIEKTIDTEYFYSYGQKINNQLFLASFESGLDSVFNLENMSCFHNVHSRPGMNVVGRSHYIQKIRNKIVSVDNSLQQIYIYDDLNLQKFHTVEFENINIRLLSISKDQTEAYMNTEISNELIVLDTLDYSIKTRLTLTNGKAFSSGNAISKDGKYICVCVRGENKLYVIQKESNQLQIVHVFKTKDMPRDLIIDDHIVYVACTNDDCIQCFDLYEKKLVREFKVYRPITFALKS